MQGLITIRRNYHTDWARRALASAIPIPVVAIGGIGPDNARDVLGAGAAAIAVISALYEGRSIEENVRCLLALL